MFNYVFQKNLQSVTSNPEKQEEWISHDTDHFFYLASKDKTYCFRIAGPLMNKNPDHLRSKVIKKLANEPVKYIGEIDRK